jgi:hypothetical protein
MIAMTRPVHIANTPIQSRSFGFSTDPSAAGGGSVEEGRGGAPVAGAPGAPAATPEPASSRRGVEFAPPRLIDRPDQQRHHRGSQVP